MSTDRIEKNVILRAPRERVWKVLSDADAFGEWFGVKLNGQLQPGARLNGRVTHKGYENYPFEFTIDRMEPGRLFSFRWHPNAIDLQKDYSSEPTTQVAFHLEEARPAVRS